MRGPWLYPTNELAYDVFMFRRKPQSLLIFHDRSVLTTERQQKSVQHEMKDIAMSPTTPRNEKIKDHPDRHRRQLLGTGSGLATAALLAATAAAGQEAPGKPGSAVIQRAVRADQGKALSASDPRLSWRARELIQIGENGIAKENASALRSYFHPDFVFHGTDGSTLDREQLWVFFAAYRAAFDNFSVTRQMIFSDGENFVASQTTFAGLFVRPFSASPVGLLQPSGKPFVQKIHNLFRFSADGRVIEEWVQYDSRLLLQSLGVFLAPAR
jgi:SnoaL-like polyketide cyclase